MPRTYKATLNRSQNRVGWAMIFRHPLKRGRDGQMGLRVRRGLGTSDDALAQRLVEQMNQLLSDQAFWSPSARIKAEEMFDPIVVNAFYDNLVPATPDYWGIRERYIPLPGRADGYARVLLLGTTGAGKTTVVRQLIGTHPKTDRFPSISAAKTTISDLEIILDQNADFRAVVSFFDRNYIRQHIEECVLAAITAHVEKGDANEIERKLLEHNEQRFRLSYLLGTTKLMATHANDASDDEFLDDILEDEEDEKLDLRDSEVSVEERQAVLVTLKSFLEQVCTIAEDNFESLSEDLDFVLDKATADDQGAFLQLLEEQVTDSELFHALVDQILDEIELKFGTLNQGELTRDSSGWPSVWTYRTDVRKDFIALINRFSSNYAPNFGRLLTPLVEGIRVIGPFAPKWHTGDAVKIVIMDREGLGHTPNSAASISTSITKRYPLADAILLVDNAAQPMQAAPTALLQSIVASGHHAKLNVFFTHFDEVRGDNLQTPRMRMDHVLGSFDNTAAGIGRQLGTRAEQVLRDLKDSRIFFGANVQKLIEAETKSFTSNQLAKLLASIEHSIVPLTRSNAVPLYDLANLNPPIQVAIRSFHQYWRAVLNLRNDPTIRPEHWTRVKALTRRLAYMGLDEYSTLKPVADLLKNLGEQMYIYLQTPAAWDPESASAEMRQATLDQIAQQVDSALYALIRERLQIQPALDWQTAFDRSGRGSATVRAYDIQAIYSQAAPIPNETTAVDPRPFLYALRKLMSESIKEGGGLVLESALPQSRA